MIMQPMCLPYNITSGYFDCSEFGKLHISPQRSVTRFEIEYYIENGKETFVNERTYSILADHVLIARNGQTRHSVLPFKSMFLKFEAEGALAELLCALPEYFSIGNTQKARELIRRIILLNESEDENCLMLYSKILEYINLLLYETKHQAPESSLHYSLVKQAQDYMNKHYAEHISLYDIASSVNLSSTYFHSVFTAYTGITPHNYLTERRLTAARELLWDSSVNISEVAERCGFCSQQYLNEVFKKMTGQSPGQYRKENRLKYNR